MMYSRSAASFSIIVAALVLPLSLAAASKCLVRTSNPVSVKLSADLAQTVPSTSIGVRAMLKNSSSEDLHDGVLFARLFASADLQGGTAFLIAQRFVAANSIELAAGEEKAAQFVWVVPKNLANGRYTLVVEYRTPDTPHATIVPDGSEGLQMEILDGAQPTIAFTQDRIAVAGRDVEITTTDAKAPFVGQLTWRLYEGGQSAFGKPKDEKHSDVRLLPRNPASGRYTLPDDSAYYLEAELSSPAGSSYAGIFIEPAGSCSPLSRLTGGSSLLLALGAVVLLGLLGAAYVYLRARDTQAASNAS